MSTSYTRSIHNPLLLWRPLVVASAILALTTLSGCARSTDALSEPEALQPETTQGDIATQPLNTAEVVAEIYEGEPTRDNWNLDNLSRLTTEWDNLDEKQRRTEVQTFLQANIPGLDMNYFERTPEGMQQMAKNMIDIYSLVTEMSFNPQIENVDMALEHIIATMSGNEEVKAELLDKSLYRLETEREAIGKPYEEGYREYRASCYVIDGFLKTSEDFYFTVDNKAVFASATYTNTEYRHLYVFYFSDSVEHGPDEPAGGIQFDSIVDNSEYDIVNFGNGDQESTEDLYNSIPEK